MKLNLCSPWRKRRSAPPQGMYGTCLREYKCEELYKATKGFSEDLGTSGCFRLHRGMLPHSTLVLVKIVPGTMKPNLNARKAMRVAMIYNESRRHINVLPLVGFYIGSDVVMLVYEYMRRMSLDLHLFQHPMEEDFNNSHHQPVLDWNKRYQIALGIARGLTYIHSSRFSLQMHPTMPENILLDSDFCPKLTHCHSLLRCVWEFDEHYWSLTTSSRKTRGYIAPEVLQVAEPSFNREPDVYSYGMLLFEIISGIRNSENGETPMSFPNRVASVIRASDGNILSVLDRRLARNANEDEVLRVCNLACWCIHDYPQQRPSMETVVDVLEGLIDDNVITSSFANVHKCSD